MAAAGASGFPRRSPVARKSGWSRVTVSRCWTAVDRLSHAACVPPRVALPTPCRLHPRLAARALAGSLQGWSPRRCCCSRPAGAAASAARPAAAADAASPADGPVAPGMPSARPHWPHADARPAARPRGTHLNFGLPWAQGVASDLALPAARSPGLRPAMAQARRRIALRCSPRRSSSAPRSSSVPLPATWLPAAPSARALLSPCRVIIDGRCRPRVRARPPPAWRRPAERSVVHMA